MNEPTPGPGGATPKSVPEQISTCWPTIRNPVQFVMRYAKAIQKYVAISHLCKRRPLELSDERLKSIMQSNSDSDHA